MPTCSAGHDSASTDFCDVCGIRLGAAGPAPAPPGQPGSGSSAAGATPVQPGFGPASAPAPSEPCPQCGAGRTGQFCEACGYSFASGVVRVTTAPSYPPPPTGPSSGPPTAPGILATGQGAAAPGPAAAPAPAGPPGQGGPVGQGGAPGGAGGTGPAGAAARPGSAATGPAPGLAPDQGPAAGTAAWTAVVTADRAYFDSVIAASGPEAAGLEFPAYCPERRFRLQGPQMRIGRRSVSRGLEPEIDLTGPPSDPGVSHLHAVLFADSNGGWTVFDPGSANGTQVNGTEIAAGSRVRLRDGDRVCVGAWTVLTIRAA